MRKQDGVTVTRARAAGEKEEERTEGKERSGNALGKSENIKKPRSTFRYGIICTFFALFSFTLLDNKNI